MTTVQRPNQEALNRALNAYIDAMRPFILDSLVQAYGASGLNDAILNSLGEEQASNFARDLERNGGNIAATIDVGHFSSIVRHHWDNIFFARFGYDQSMQGTLSWITRARNDAAHPGQTDISSDDTQSHLNNIAKVLERIGATDACQVVYEIRANLTTPQSSYTLPETQQAAPAGSITINSVCANARCQAINTSTIETHYDFWTLTCQVCLSDYYVNVFRINSLHVETRQITIFPNATIEREYNSLKKEADPQNHSPNVIISRTLRKLLPASFGAKFRQVYVYFMRITLPRGEQSTADLFHIYDLHLSPDDVIILSFDNLENMVFIYNQTINQFWYCGGGGYSDRAGFVRKIIDMNNPAYKYARGGRFVNL